MKLTHPERVLYPEVGITKRDLARYYERVADAMLPHVARRPLTLVRCPDGVGGPCFYQKKRGEGLPDALLGVEIEDQAGARATYVMVDSGAGLVALAQLGVLEIHPWGSRAERLDRPDRLTFDLDPGPGVAWAELVDAARQLRELLLGLGLTSFLKLTGGKGLHLVVPIVAEIGWPEARELTAAIARLLAAEPETRGRYTTQMSKRRRQGRIFIDTLRNAYGNTAVAPYSTRARPRAPVATPIRWDELRPGLAPDYYHLRNLPRRLAALDGDPWATMAAAAKRLRPAVRKRLLADEQPDRPPRRRPVANR